MIDAANLVYFLIAAGLLLVVPGPAVFYIIARSVEQGTTAGLVSTVGVGVGSIIHVLAGALGLSALLYASATGFLVVKYLGAAYLLYLGIRTLLDWRPSRAPVLGRKRLSRIFREGIAVNVLNPKTALFFFAFLPQFISAERGSVTGQFLFLGTLLVSLGLISDGVYAVLAGSVSKRMGSRAGAIPVGRYLSATIYIGLGLVAALSEPARR